MQLDCGFSLCDVNNPQKEMNDESAKVSTLHFEA